MTRAWLLACLLLPLFGCREMGELELQQLLRQAEQDDAHSQFLAGNIYKQGTTGVPQDFASATKWMRMAAEQGYIDAQIELGDWYRYGVVGQKDEIEARKWYLFAAEQGHADAQWRVAERYMGYNQIRAHMWLNLAASNPDIRDSERWALLRDTLGMMTPEQTAEAQRLAREWRPKTWEELQ